MGDDIKNVLTSPDFRNLLKSVIKEVVEEQLIKRLELCEGEILEMRNELDQLKSNMHKERQIREKESRELYSQLTATQKELDEAQQYSQRNNLRIAGIPETTGENTTELIKNLA